MCKLLFRWHDQWKNLDPNKIELDEQPHKNIWFTTLNAPWSKTMVMLKLKINPLYLIIDKTNWYIKNGNKYLTLVANNESKDIKIQRTMGKSEILFDQ